VNYESDNPLILVHVRIYVLIFVFIYVNAFREGCMLECMCISHLFHVCMDLYVEFMYSMYLCVMYACVHACIKSLYVCLCMFVCIYLLICMSAHVCIVGAFLLCSRIKRCISTSHTYRHTKLRTYEHARNGSLVIISFFSSLRCLTITE
jgi:hypothetical protein